MKKAAIIIAVVIIFIGCSGREINANRLENRDNIYYEINQQEPFTGKCEFYYKVEALESKKKLLEMTYKNGIADGPFVYYYRNGQVESKGVFKNKKIEGIRKNYYENGQLRAKGIYKNGIVDGIFEYYYENGQLKEEYIYKNGVLNGFYKEYYENGQLKMEKVYKNGELERKSDNN